MTFQLHTTDYIFIWYATTAAVFLLPFFCVPTSLAFSLVLIINISIQIYLCQGDEDERTVAAQLVNSLHHLTLPNTLQVLETLPF